MYSGRLLSRLTYGHSPGSSYVLVPWFPTSECSVECRGGTGTDNTRARIHEARQTKMAVRDHSALLGWRRIGVRVHQESHARSSICLCGFMCSIYLVRRLAGRHLLLLSAENISSRPDGHGMSIVRVMATQGTYFVLTGMNSASLEEPRIPVTERAVAILVSGSWETMFDKHSRLQAFTVDGMSCAFASSSLPPGHK